MTETTGDTVVALCGSAFEVLMTSCLERLVDECVWYNREWKRIYDGSGTHSPHSTVIAHCLSVWVQRALDGVTSISRMCPHWCAAFIAAMEAKRVTETWERIAVGSVCSRLYAGNTQCTSKAKDLVKLMGDLVLEGSLSIAPTESYHRDLRLCLDRISLVKQANSDLLSIPLHMPDLHTHAILYHAFLPLIYKLVTTTEHTPTLVHAMQMLKKLKFVSTYPPKSLVLTKTWRYCELTRRTRSNMVESVTNKVDITLQKLLLQHALAVLQRQDREGAVLKESLGPCHDLLLEHFTSLSKTSVDNTCRGIIDRILQCMTGQH
eukprot:GFYU01051226.1.p1 GENE.GFYU01051226.1~~GFYU01051226.1.p1  ORF type:complete len:358 (-),score=45.33 GFYU01051226.1:93-1052(-)